MKFIMIVCMLFLIASCGKKSQIKVTAKNAVTGEGYAGLGFRIYKIRFYTTSTGEIRDLVYEGTLNENGEAIVDLRLKNRTYVVTTITPENDNRCYINDTRYFFHRDDENLKFDFRFAPCAYLKFSYKNIDCQGSEDYFEAYRYTNLENYTGFIANAAYEGCTNYTMPNFVEVPMGWWFFEWQVIKNGVEANFKDSVYLDVGEKVHYDFKY